MPLYEYKCNSCGQHFEKMVRFSELDQRPDCPNCHSSETRKQLSSFANQSTATHCVVLSTPDEGVGMKPSELLLVALASCTAVDVVEILQKKRIELSSLEISATGEQQTDPPWTFRKIHLLYRVSGKGLTEEAAELAVRLSEKKYCSVAPTL